MQRGGENGAGSETVRASAQNRCGVCNIMEKLKVRLAQCGQIDDLLKKHLTVAGILREAFAQHDVNIVIVGGAAVQFYTQGHYATRDLDIITTYTDKLNEIMPRLGFQKKGRVWVHAEDASLIVDFPAGPLAGDWFRVQPVIMEDTGEITNIIAIEDIIIDRLLAVKYWSDSEEWVQFMMVAHFDEIDWAYCEQRAKTEDCADILCKMRKWAEDTKQMLD